MAVSPTAPLPEAGQIWYLEYPRLEDSDYAHFVLVTSCANDTVYFYYLATERKDRDDLEINQHRPEFRKTGLKHTSHVLVNHYHYVPLDGFLAEAVYKGSVEGGLKKIVENWVGEKF